MTTKTIELFDSTGEYWRAERQPAWGNILAARWQITLTGWHVVPRKIIIDESPGGELGIPHIGGMDGDPTRFVSTLEALAFAEALTAIANNIMQDRFGDAS